MFCVFMAPVRYNLEQRMFSYDCYVHKKKRKRKAHTNHAGENFTLNFPTQHFRLEIKKKLHGLSPRANYTDRATAACRRSDCQLVRIEDATWSALRIPPAAFLGFLDRSHYFLSSSSSVCTHEAEWTPFQTPLYFFFLVVLGIEPGPPDL
jgi:hypothetical protein